MSDFYVNTGAQQRAEEADRILWRSIHQYDRAHYDGRNYGSVILIDGQEVAHLLCCKHCRGHFLNVKIPGKERGWCMNCNGPVCPRKECDDCIPFMKQLEMMEKHLRIDQMPISVAVSLPNHLLSKSPAPVVVG